MNAVAWLFVSIALVAIGTIGVFALLHARANRKRWARYSMPAGSGKLTPVLCPHCRQRSYSPRAIAERRCPNCGREY